ncbi:CBS domain-containing protein [Candidatus Woesearchaeota archaeon]|nr:CBS domain-containing protein [Candidatus Woesearchaeota archaeon]
MAIELNEIKHVRKKFGMTQTQLAKQAGVSQSLIAKIEAGRIDPTYSKVKKIVDVLHDITHDKEVKAEEVMNPKVIALHPEDTIKEAIKKIKNYGISQLPVLNDHKVVGTISETILLDALLQGKGRLVRDVMTESPPVVSKKASIRIVSNLLTFYPMVLVADGGRLEGVITKSDVLSKLYKTV